MPKDRERYFQTIARHLFSLRGAPFVLSTREMEAAEAWESDGIPLDTVLEGMNRGYEEIRSRRGLKGRKLTLSFCHPFVLRAFALLRDREVGREIRVVSRKDKCGEIRKAVEAFLENIPPPVSDLRPTYVAILEELVRGAWDSDRLEFQDAEIEDRLFRLASRRDRALLAEEIAQEHGVENREELSRLVRIKWVKSMRDRHKIPHVSPFYY